MPGVPPDAVDNVKKLFKGLFKRGKNKKQDKPAEQAPATSTSTQPSTAAATQQTPATTNGGAPNTDKPLPPTQPAQAEAKKEDVPHTQIAQPGAVERAQEVKKEPDSQGVSPTSATPAPTSEPVSAIEKSTPPPPPPKTEEPAVATGTADAPKPAETTGKENVAPPATAPKAEVTPEAPSTAPTQPNGTAEEVKKVDPPVEGDKAVKAADEKVPVHEEPAPVKPVQSATGMSATSGPLEDFPEGGAHQ